MSLKDTILYEAKNNLYLNITNRCTSECLFCIKNFSDGVYGYNLRLLKEPETDEIIKRLSEIDLSSYKEIVFTGFGEPLIRLDDVLKITKWLKSKNVYIRVDTNGHVKLLYPGRNIAKEMHEAGIDAVSISLNAHDSITYNKLCLPKFENAYNKILEFAHDIVKNNIKLIFTVVDIPLIDIEKTKKIAKQYGAEFIIRKCSDPK